MKFLIIQQKSPIRDYLEKILMNEGNEFLSIENESELDITYKHYKPDYVVLDIDSRDRNGLKLAEKLRRNDIHAFLLFISEIDNNWLREKYNNIANTAFISKENLHKLGYITELEKITRRL